MLRSRNRLLRRAQGARVWRVGFPGAGAASANQHFLDAFVAGLRASGYVPGGNAIVEVRWAEGRFELVVNLRAAGALGLTIPQSILLRADEVIR